MSQGKGLRISGDGQVRLCYGTGDPNASTDQFVTAADVGSLYFRRDGGSSTSLYVCEGTQTLATTGVVALWVAK